MEKTGALISRLQQQYSQQADESLLLNTALMLVAELQNNHNNSVEPGKVSVIMPYKPFETMVSNNTIAEEEINTTKEDTNLSFVTNEPSLPEEEITEEQIEPTPEPEAVETEPVFEPEPQPVQTSAINTLAEEKYTDELIEQIPTLAQQQPKVLFELNETAQQQEQSINDKLKSYAPEAGSKVNGEPIKDLKRAIGINDKYLFMKELFRNDETAYERSIKTINSFSILPEAEYWIQREMKYKLGWDDDNATVKAFYQLVKRRFS